MGESSALCGSSHGPQAATTAGRSPSRSSTSRREIPTTEPGRLLAGQVGKPHGTGGEVYVIRISDDPQRFAPGARLIHEDGRELVVASARSHRDRFLVWFEGVSDRSSAQDLRGALYVPVSEVRELGTDEYWVHDLVGCRVFDPAGRDIGVVVSVIPNPAQDLLAVDTPEGERLIPAVRPILVAVDLTERRVTVDPPDGLLES